MTRFLLGDVEIRSVLDLVVPFDPGRLIVGASRESVAGEFAHLRGRLVDARTGDLQIAMQSYLLKLPGRIVLVDAACGNDRQRPRAPMLHMLDTPYLERLGACGVAPGDVDMVFITHLHLDHVGWCVRKGSSGFEPTFANARHRINRAEYRHWKRLYEAQRAEGDSEAGAFFFECVEPLVAAGLVDFVEDGEVLHDEGGGSLTAERLPGHSPHHMGLHLRSGAGHVLFCGDVVQHALQVERTGLRSHIDSDKAEARRTVEDLVSRYADTGTYIAPAHSVFPHIGRLRRSEGRVGLAYVDAADGAETVRL